MGLMNFWLVLFIFDALFSLFFTCLADDAKAVTDKDCKGEACSGEFIVKLLNNMSGDLNDKSDKLI